MLSVTAWPHFLFLKPAFFFKLISGECRPRDLCFTGLESCCKIGPLQLELGDMMDASFLDVPFESVAVIPSCRVSH